MHCPLRLDYHENLKQTLFNIKMHRRIGVVIVWLYGKYLETFFINATEKDLQGKTLKLDDGNTIEEIFPLDPRFSILSGSQVIDSYDYPVPAFEEQVKMITPANSATIGVEWWREFWRSQFSCSVAKSFELGTKARRENFTLHHAFPQLHSSLVSYTIDAGYAIAYVLDNIDRCKAEQGF